MHDSRLERIHRHYAPRVSKDRESYDILDWGSAESQRIRFGILVECMREAFGDDLSMDCGLRLLDVGCGLADLWVFLCDAGVSVSYFGVDVTEEILQECRRRHPELTLSCQDVFADGDFGTYDIVYCSGVFNLALGNNDEFAVRGMRRLVSLSSCLTVANFLHARASYHYDHCHYYDPEALLARLSDLDLVLRDDYLENDFSLISCRRENHQQRNVK